MTKICKTCLILKPLNEFSREKRNTDGRTGKCKSCLKEANHLYYKQNKTIINTKNNQRYHREKKKRSMQAKERYKNNKEYRQQKIDYSKKYSLDHKSERQQYMSDYRANNKPSIRESKNKYKANKRKNNICFRLGEIVGGHIYKALKNSGTAKTGRSWDKLNYTKDDLKFHIESQFVYWMNWNNHGLYCAENWDINDENTWKWQIDHIIPHSKLPYDNLDHINFKICWHLKNLRPLIAIQNTKDSARPINMLLLKEILIDIKIHQDPNINVDYILANFTE